MKKLLSLLMLCMLLSVAQSQENKWFTDDHQKHIAAGMAIGGTGNQISETLFDGKHKELTTIALPTVVGFGWELMWMNEPGNRFDWKDVAMTALGGGIAYGLDKAGVHNAITIGVGIGWLGFKMSF